MTAKAARSMAEIEREIARTRADLGLTLDALAVELAPGHVIEKGVDMITDFLNADRPGGISLGAGLRADPVALALIGLGVAWLVAGNTGIFAGVTPHRDDAEAGEDAVPAERIMGPGGEPAHDGHRNGRRDGWMRHAAGAAQDALRSICESGGAVLERAGGYLEDITHSGGHAQRTGGRLLAGAEDNPLLLGVLGLVSGAALAMLLPAGRREQEIVAQARNDLWEKAEALGHSAADCVRAMAEGSSRTAPDC